MLFRYARHTTDLKRMETFYTQTVGLQTLGGFTNHSGYDGLFLGNAGEQWHLEFTVSEELPHHSADEDDILVFYCHSEPELAAIRRMLEQQQIGLEVPKNPYWIANGLMVSDPDGYKVVFAMRDIELGSMGALTQLAKNKGIFTWNELMQYVQQLPYGRNQNRADCSLVLTEQQGTCSSKHALLKKVADENGMHNVKLMLGLFEMNEHNTPRIGKVLREHGLFSIPEAHCYLSIDNRRIDVTMKAMDAGVLDALLVEVTIEPEQVDTYKVEFHQAYMKDWVTQKGMDKTPEELWVIREQCIAALAQS